jgi:hypothetical protein
VIVTRSETSGVPGIAAPLSRLRYMPDSHVGPLFSWRRYGAEP